MADEYGTPSVGSSLRRLAAGVERAVVTPEPSHITELAVRKHRRQRHYLVSAIAAAVLAAAATSGVLLSGGSTGHHQQPHQITLLAASLPTGFSRLSAYVAPDGRGWALTTAGLELTSNGGKSFRVVKPPIPAPAITGVAVFADQVTVAGIVFDSSGPRLEVTYSDDGGSSWAEATLPAAFNPGSAELVSNGGSVIGMLVTSVTSSAFSEGVWYSTTDNGRRWSVSAAPCGGTAVDIAGDLWLAGGVLNNQLYMSLNNGRTWTLVSNPVSRSSGQPGLSVPGALGNGDVVLVSTIPSPTSSAPEVNVYTSGDLGRSWKVFTKTMTLGGSVGSGVTTPASVADGAIWLGSLDESEVVVISPDVVQSLERSSTLSATVDSIAASSRSTAWVVASRSQCPSGKSSCAQTFALFRTANAGASWSRVDLTPSSSS